ncbi:toprim domain-containing protein [Spirosoma sp. RP8]|uniref:Toprim domain-containing protein n=1 Tax=Spirosoma liriopis TaxID=2937440 RepID=A0ABT0HDG3_9BACT|nr:DnaB-like helicase C-terminal domain-containing protein [Spirosoma liriopis]MCK8490219.1 toprim domain-containing protein [Spirosoma liriopis]
MATYDELGIDVKLHGSRNQKVKCPMCSHQRKNKSDKSLSVDLTRGLYNCHYCSWHGFVTDKTDEEIRQDRKKYAKPEPIELPLNDNTIRWFKDQRGIDPETLQYFRVSESKEWMPERDGHAAGKRSCINFNYFRDGEKVNVKYRDKLKCFRLTKDAELVLYNLDSLKDRSTCLICEGEIDAMTFYQSGHYGAVSVPNGASKGSAKLEYLDNCWSALEKMQKIIIAVDGDQAGEFLKNELIRRFGKHRCWVVEYPADCKDANEVLLKHGIEAVRTLWQSAVAPPLESVLLVDDLRAELEDIALNGWPKSDAIGYEGFDHLLRFRRGEVTTVTGIPAHGKGEFTDQIAIRLASRHGWKVGVFSYEEPSFIKVIKLCQRYTGLPYYRSDKNAMMNATQRNAALNFVNDHFFFIDIDTADLTIDGILDKGRELVLRKGIDLLIIDPYNCIESKRQAFQSETEYVSEVMGKITRFARLNDVHVFLVAHPTKMRKDDKGNYYVPTLYDIAGSSNFFNKTYNGICVYRNYETNTADVHVQKVKFFFNGQLGSQTFKFDPDTSRYAEEGRPVWQTEIEFQQKRKVQLAMDLEPSTPVEPPSAEASQPEPPKPTGSNSFQDPLDKEDVPF